MVLRISLFVLLFLAVLITAKPTNAQESCQPSDSSFESILIGNLVTIEEEQQEQVGDPGRGSEKDPHLFLPPFQALPGIGTGLPMSIQLLATSIRPIPLPVIPTSGINNDNITLFGLNTACEVVEVSSDPN